MKKGIRIKAILVGVVITGVLALAGCDENQTAKEEKEYTAQMQNQISASIGKPDVSNYFEYSQLKEIYEKRDNPNLICYWYTKNDYTGKFIYQGKCVGYGIPYGASITANEVPDYNSYEDNAHLKQAEPNGLYTDSVVTTATWILSVTEEGEINPTYVESEITVSQTKIPASKCEEWSLGEDYSDLSEKAEIAGEVEVEEKEVSNEKEEESEENKDE